MAELGADDTVASTPARGVSRAPAGDVAGTTDGQVIATPLRCSHRRCRYTRRTSCSLRRSHTQPNFNGGKGNRSPGGLLSLSDRRRSAGWRRHRLLGRSIRTHRVAVASGRVRHARDPGGSRATALAEFAEAPLSPTGARKSSLAIARKSVERAPASLTEASAALRDCRGGGADGVSGCWGACVVGECAGEWLYRDGASGELFVCGDGDVEDADLVGAVAGRVEGIVNRTSWPAVIVLSVPSPTRNRPPKQPLTTGRVIWKS